MCIRDRNTDLVFVVMVFFAVILLVLPVPPLVLDLFLAVSIGISLLVLLVVIYVKDPTEFSVFPTVLLVVTLFRLGLNVASTRLILLNGHTGIRADICARWGDRLRFAIHLLMGDASLTMGSMRCPLAQLCVTLWQVQTIAWSNLNCSSNYHCDGLCAY